MIIRRSEMQSEVRDRMRGGEGSVRITHLVQKEALPHGRLLAEIEIPPGAGIGEHEHTAETEYFLIEQGTGVAVDDGRESRITAGDVLVTGGGARHSIRNDSDAPLRLVALIIVH